MGLRTVLVVLVHAGLIGIGVWLLVIDIRTHRLPNRIVLPTLLAVVLLAVLDAVAMGESGALVRALWGLVILGGFYALLRIASRAGMGGGDVKLAALIGVVLGWHSWTALAVGAASAFVLAALYALALIALRRATGSTRIAFGPWMIIGAVLGVAIA
ncbi:Type 4 prepilin-like proteins leader peptide-processing enzyme [Microbacterium hydrocarbonoxydans]|uniref:Type 4 prepilin-like proteins leader peptide-processing enzyme n=1 Tax=Microbacterium hydrocarbonoxydans TaxID=273678 RepID=A0A0M2HM01_9MICO|nr:A24 family peptidase [Microbacterium hydrocarbonoxydans]KJL45958.1 Type 4 prepilin-like proteins leader peptide-processing enzyme [Microbacterium hydrocarbonoxydans]